MGKKSFKKKKINKVNTLEEIAKYYNYPTNYIIPPPPIINNKPLTNNK